MGSQNSSPIFLAIPKSLHRHNIGLDPRHGELVKAPFAIDDCICFAITTLWDSHK